ncbi:hypothetical protein BKA57DRAFT_464892 [Linnemannia elongata]|nr:hypothetical protein BKA57DRAFT_464892 [Linnemannia elongata]
MSIVRFVLYFRFFSILFLHKSMSMLILLFCVGSMTIFGRILAWVDGLPGFLEVGHLPRSCCSVCGARMQPDDGGSDSA